MLAAASRAPQLAAEGARSHCAASFANTLAHVLLKKVWNKERNPLLMTPTQGLRKQIIIRSA